MDSILRSFDVDYKPDIIVDVSANLTGLVDTQTLSFLIPKLSQPPPPHVTLSKYLGVEIFPKYTELFSIPNSNLKPLKNPMGPYSILNGSSVNMWKFLRLLRHIA